MAAVIGKRKNASLILHEAAFIVVGPTKTPVRLRPMMFSLLAYLLRLPPRHVALYTSLEAVLWPQGVGLPSKPQDLIRWHAHHLNRLLAVAGCTAAHGFPDPPIRAVERRGLEHLIPSHRIIIHPSTENTSRIQRDANEDIA